MVLHIVQPVEVDDAPATDLLEKFDMLMRRLQHEPYWRPTVEELARLTAISPSHFMRTFRQYTGFSPMAYLERQRIKQASDLLMNTSRSVLEISTALGYASSQHFATAFKRVTGMTPLAWRKSSR